MMAEPMKTLELHYPTIQFLIKRVILTFMPCGVETKTVIPYEGKIKNVQITLMCRCDSSIIE